MSPHGIVFAPKHNTHGKHDATGAFIPEARRFAELHGCAVYLFDNRQTMAKRRAEVEEVLRAARFDAFATPVVGFFCHGWKNGIQAGWRTPQVPALAELVAHVIDSNYLIMPLYACDAARDDDGERDDDLTEGPGGDGGFADELRDALCVAGVTDCVVDAHATAGHTTRNPYVRRFEGQGSPVGGQGGAWIVRPRSAMWRAWVSELRGEMRLMFPLLPTAVIHEELLAAA